MLDGANPLLEARIPSGLRERCRQSLPGEKPGRSRIGAKAALVSVPGGRGTIDLRSPDSYRTGRSRAILNPRLLCFAVELPAWLNVAWKAASSPRFQDP